MALNLEASQHALIQDMIDDRAFTYYIARSRELLTAALPLFKL
jgi:hypothetical protein